jgi:hypothetical protein
MYFALETYAPAADKRSAASSRVRSSWWTMSTEAPPVLFRGRAQDTIWRKPMQGSDRCEHAKGQVKGVIWVYARVSEPGRIRLIIRRLRVQVSLPEQPEVPCASGSFRDLTAEFNYRLRDHCRLLSVWDRCTSC